MNRSRIRPAVITFAALLTAFLGGCQNDRGASATHPNLVLICLDTVRYDSFMLPGTSDALDSWLRRAQIYENAMSAAPWTLPSVASVLTGLYPLEHGAGLFPDEVANLRSQAPSGLARDRLTLAEALQSEGFRTGAFFSHPFFRADLGLEQGFEALRQQKGWASNVGKFWEWQGGLLPDQRFFAYFHFMEAHDFHLKDPNVLSARLQALDPPLRTAVRERSNPALCEEPERLMCKRNEVYNATVLELRSALASLLQQLEQRGLLDRTVVMVYSDHGEEFWEHVEEEKTAAEDPRRHYGFGHGHSLYQELLHVPLLAWRPGWAGARHTEPVSLVDVMPSLLSWLGVGMRPADLSGVELPSPIRGHEPRPDNALFASGIAYGPEQVAVRSDHLKTIYTLRDQRFEYFDLEGDPGEHRPVASDSLTMLFDTLTGDYLSRRRPVASTAHAFDPQQLKALQAIGYLQGVSDESGNDASAGPDDGDADTNEARQ
jgi:arylsulfatase A-like enzyme